MINSNVRLRNLVGSSLLIILLLPALGGDKKFSMAKVYPVDSGHSYVGFQVKYMGYAKVRGRFEDFSGAVYFDPDDITQTSATVVIKAGSIDTDLAWRDKDLRSADWFDVDNHPTITFRSTRVEEKAGQTFFHGQLTMRGITKAVALELHENSGILKDTRGDNQIILTFSTVVDRNDFDIKGERWSKIKEEIAAVAAEVEIELTVLAKQVLEANYRNWVKDTSRARGRIYKAVVDAGVEAGLAEFDRIRAAGNRKRSASDLDVVGQMLLKEGRTSDAITVFEHNVSLFPDNSNSFDSLAEAYATAGQFKKAVENYRHVLAQDPHNSSALEILRHISD